MPVVEPYVYPPLELEPSVSRTKTTAPDRDRVEPAPKLTLSALPRAPVQLPSDADLAREEARAALSAPGLGPLPVDEAGLMHQLVGVVRVQGLEFATNRVRALRANAEAQRDASSGGVAAPRSLARAEALLERVEILERGLAQLEDEQTKLRLRLQPRMLAEAARMLDASSRRLRSIERTYWPDGRPDAPALEDLAGAAEALLRMRERIERASREPSPRLREVRVQAARAEYAARLDRASERHPVLRAFGPDSERGAALESLAEDPAAGLRAIVEGSREAIGEMRSRLRDDPSTVWRLGAVVQSALLRAGVPSHGMVAGHARDLVRRARASDERFRSLVSFVALGLGVAAAMPSGGASLAVASAATAAADGYQLYLAIDRYRFDVAAAGSDPARGRALAEDEPSGWDLAFDALGAAGSGAGAVVALARLVPRADALGDLARGLEAELGFTRGDAIVEGFGSAQATLEVWTRAERSAFAALSGLSPDNLRAAATALGPDAWTDWTRALGPKGFAELVEKTPPGVWRDLLSTPLGPAEALDVVRAYDAEALARLAPALKGRGLVLVLDRLGRAPGVADDGYLLVDGRLRVHPRALLGGSTERVARQRQRLAGLLDRAPTLAEVGAVQDNNLRLLEQEAIRRAKGEVASAREIARITEPMRAEPRTVRRIIDELAQLPFPALSPKAEALAQAAPELRYHLHVLARQTHLPEPLCARVVDAVDAAVRHSDVRFDRAHLLGWMAENLDKTKISAKELRSRLLEVEAGLALARADRIEPGSTVFIGVRSAETITLRPGGPTVHLPKQKGTKGILQELDVVFLGTDGRVHALEVKAHPKALWEELRKNSGYLNKLVQWRAEPTLGPAREVHLWFGERAPAGLDSPIAHGKKAPRQLLEDAGFEYEFAPGG